MSIISIDIQLTVIVTGEALAAKNHNQDIKNYTRKSCRYMQKTLIINRQFVKTNTCFPLFSYTFFHFPPSTNSNFGDLGKNGDGPPLFIYVFPIPNSKFQHVLGKMVLDPTRLNIHL